MSSNYLHSLILHLTARNDALIPRTMGHKVHAAFLDLVKQVDQTLSDRLHNENGYRPFTVSPLTGGSVQGEQIALRAGHPCRLRLTLLDGGRLWDCLSSRVLAADDPLIVRLGAADLGLTRLLATPAADPSGWAGFTDWQALAATPARRHITIQFASPTAFNLGDKHFALFPEPKLVWESFMRVWNLYAPPVLHLDRPALTEFITRAVVVSDYNLSTATLHYPGYTQKGFVGTCTYLMPDADPRAAQLAALAEFSRYAGVGYKTTMGMGQARPVAPPPYPAETQVAR
ncbi:MAG: CRISPR system precrRNA processing endoribonuclease RAMP protein Cas6 [Chloroflexia bacterium]